MNQLLRSLSVFTLILICSASTFAAQDSTVIEENAPVVAEPKTSAKVLEYLEIGSEIRISSFPMQGGWYKVRSKTGEYGWIHESYLSVYKPKVEANKEDKYKPERDRRWFVRFLGGFDFFRPSDLNALFDFSELNTGYALGGELGFFISPKVALSFRTEALLKDVFAKENQSGAHFNLALRSYPVMGGFDFFITKLPALRLSLGLYAGAALATSFSSEGSSLSQPNIMVLQRNPFTALARLNLTRPLGRVISVFGEAGYRYLRTEEIETRTAANIQGGKEVYSRDGIFRNRVIDLSGVVVSIGMGVHF